MWQFPSTSEPCIAKNVCSGTPQIIQNLTKLSLFRPFDFITVQSMPNSMSWYAKISLHPILAYNYHQINFETEK